MGRKPIDMVKLNEHFAKETIAKIASAGMTHQDFAALASISRSRFSELINCQKVFTLTDIVRIADALNIKASTLVSNAEKRLQAETMAEEISEPLVPLTPFPGYGEDAGDLTDGEKSLPYAALDTGISPEAETAELEARKALRD
ncbi:Uncharacterised protein [Chlamydia trachomatis]|nr:Uncharacterised protein [Chlamydia trachomatis]